MPPLILCVGHMQYDKVIIEETLREITPRVDCFFVSNATGMLQSIKQSTPRVILGELDECPSPSCDALIRLRSDTEYRHLPFVVFTARAALGDVKYVYDYGANSMVGKPTDLQEWRSTMAALVHYWFEIARCCDEI
jgi:CheY-like chemotaxis protein